MSKNVSFILQDRDNLTEESIKSSRGLVSRRKGGWGHFGGAPTKEEHSQEGQ